MTAKRGDEEQETTKELFAEGEGRKIEEVLGELVVADHGYGAALITEAPHRTLTV